MTSYETKSRLFLLLLFPSDLLFFRDGHIIATQALVSRLYPGQTSPSTCKKGLGHLSYGIPAAETSARLLVSAFIKAPNLSCGEAKITHYMNIASSMSLIVWPIPLLMLTLFTKFTVKSLPFPLLTSIYYTLPFFILSAIGLSQHAVAFLPDLV